MNDNRFIEDCGYRRDRPQSDANASFQCGLICELLNCSDAGIVSAEACRACCSSQPTPTLEDLNPVVASLLYMEVERIQHQTSNQRTGISAQRLAELGNWAEDSIPVLFPHETEDAPSPCLSFHHGVSVADIENVLPLPMKAKSKDTSIQWAVGITTAPRRQPTLSSCIDTVTLAGWESPHLFVDGDVEIPGQYDHLVQTTRTPQLGPWLNYFLSLSDLVRREPDADAYMLIQDDVIFPPTPAVIEYLNQVIWPTSDANIVSLFCSADYDSTEPGWSSWDATWYVGAQAFVFSKCMAEAFLADEKVATYERVGDGLKKAGIDVVIGEWAKRREVKIYRPTPSLVQHAGHVSAIWDTSRVVGLRRANQFVGDLLR